MLAEPGLPASLYAAAEQSRLLAVLAEGGIVDGRRGDFAVPPWSPTRRSLGATGASPSRWTGCGRRPAPARATRAGVLSRIRADHRLLGARPVRRRAGVRAGAADELAVRSDPLWAAAPAVFAARIDLVAGQLDEARRRPEPGWSDHPGARHANARPARAPRARPGRRCTAASSLRPPSRRHPVAGRAPRRPGCRSGPRTAPGPASGWVRRRASRCSVTGRTTTAFDLVAGDRCSFWRSRLPPPGWSASPATPATSHASHRWCGRRNTSRR